MTAVMCEESQTIHEQSRKNRHSRIFKHTVHTTHRRGRRRQQPAHLKAACCITPALVCKSVVRLWTSSNTLCDLQGGVLAKTCENLRFRDFAIVALRPPSPLLPAGFLLVSNGPRYPQVIPSERGYRPLALQATPCAS